MRWAPASLIPHQSSRAFLSATKPLYDSQLANLAALFYVTHLWFEGNPERLERAAKEFERKLTSGELEPGWYTEPCQLIDGVPAAPELLMTCSFWIRRQVDGSRGAFVEALRQLLRVYDPETLQDPPTLYSQLEYLTLMEASFEDVETEPDNAGGASGLPDDTAAGAGGTEAKAGKETMVPASAPPPPPARDRCTLCLKAANASDLSTARNHYRECKPRKGRESCREPLPAGLIRSWRNSASKADVTTQTRSESSRSRWGCQQLPCRTPATRPRDWCSSETN